MQLNENVLKQVSTISFHCLFCHGFEERDSASAGVLAVGDIASVGAALHLARMAKRLAPTVTIYTNGAEDLYEQIILGLNGSEIKVDKRRIARLEQGSGSEQTRVIVHLEDGTDIREGFLVRLALLVSNLLVQNAAL